VIRATTIMSHKGYCVFRVKLSGTAAYDFDIGLYLGVEEAVEQRNEKALKRHIRLLRVTRSNYRKWHRAARHENLMF